MDALSVFRSSEAQSEGGEPQVIDEPVGHVDPAPTFRAIAGIDPERGGFTYIDDEAVQQGRETPTEWASGMVGESLARESAITRTAG